MLSFEVRFRYYRVVEQTNKGVLNGLKGFPLPISFLLTTFGFFIIFPKILKLCKTAVGV